MTIILNPILKFFVVEFTRKPVKRLHNSVVSILRSHWTWWKVKVLDFAALVHKRSVDGVLASCGWKLILKFRIFWNSMAIGGRQRHQLSKISSDLRYSVVRHCFYFRKFYYRSYFSPCDTFVALKIPTLSDLVAPRQTVAPATWSRTKKVSRTRPTINQKVSRATQSVPKCRVRHFATDYKLPLRDTLVHWLLD